MRTRQYTADPDMWKKHFVSMAEGKQPSVHKIVQVGGGHLGRKSQYMVNVGRQCEPHRSSPTIQYVTPTKQSVDRVKAELQRQKHSTSTSKQGIKRKRKSPSSSVQQNNRRGKKAKTDVFNN